MKTIERIQAIRELLVQRRYLRLLLPLSTLYLIAVMIVYTYIYKGNPFVFYTSYPHVFTLATSLLNVTTSLLVGVILTLIIAQWRSTIAHGASWGTVGVLFGSIAMGCPGCFFGLFPLILSLFGVTATLAILPWNGVEFQVLTVVLLSISALTLAPHDDCKLPRKSKKK